MKIFLYSTKLKAFADDKLNVAKMTNIFKEGENAGYQHFFSFLDPQYLPEFSGPRPWSQIVHEILENVASE